MSKELSKIFKEDKKWLWNKHKELSKEELKNSSKKSEEIFFG